MSMVNFMRKRATEKGIQTCPHCGAEDIIYGLSGKYLECNQPIPRNNEYLSLEFALECFTEFFIKYDKVFSPTQKTNLVKFLLQLWVSAGSPFREPACVILLTGSLPRSMLRFGRTCRDGEKNEWICMLDKNISDSEPRISFNIFKINGIQNLSDSEKSEDEVALEELKDYLKERNLELCDFYTQLGDMELECIRKADKAYPNYGQQHKEDTDKLMAEAKNELIKNYNLVDSVFVNVSVFGMM